MNLGKNGGNGKNGIFDQKLVILGKKTIDEAHKSGIFDRNGLKWAIFSILARLEAIKLAFLIENCLNLRQKWIFDHIINWMLIRRPFSIKKSFI